MTETNKPGDKTITVSPSSKTLTLSGKPGAPQTVRQSFSHGRSKAVVVEVAKKRQITPPGGRSASPPAAKAAPAAPVDVRPVAPPPAAAPAAPPPPVEVAPEPVPVVPAKPAAAPKAAPAKPAAAAPAAAPAAPTTRPASTPRAAPGSGSRAATADKTRPTQPTSPQPSRAGGMVLRTLSEEEKEMRARILQDAKAREDDDRRRALEEANRRQELEEVQRRERVAAETRRREEEDRHRREDETKRRAEAEAKRRLGDDASAAPARSGAPAAARPGAATRPGATPATTLTPRSPLGLRRPAEEEDDDSGRARPGARKTARPAPARPEKREVDRRPGRIDVTAALNDEDGRARSVAAMKRRVQRNQRRMMGDQPREKLAREVVLPETITIQELANRMSERAVDVIRFLMRQGQLAKITDIVDADTAQLIAEDFGHTVKRVADSDVEEGLFTQPDDVGEMQPRPPVVTIMGHVDHGKTSLLDAIRKTNVVSGEAGGITQHIGAYQVSAPKGDKITFIDTPGHAAFTAMRARGAKVTDLVILVVAADDGVMPQTVEAISHAKAAKVPMIVAINKIDKPDANPTRVRTDLLQHDVQVESMGGETLEVEVSAKTGQGLDKLLETIALQSEVLDLKAKPDRPAEAIVVEAKLDRGRGPVASAIVQRGTLKVGDIVVAGSAWGRVRALVTDTGDTVAEAGPSMPVEILGFAGVPEAGDRLAVVDNEARARDIAAYRERKKRERAQARAAGQRTTLADMMSQIKTGVGKKELMLVVKGDVQGSVEAVAGALAKLGNDEVGARILQSGVGGITESDVTLASASKAVIIGFNVRASREAREAADREGIEIRYYNIIYNLVDDVKQAMTGLLAPTYREEMLGNAEILEVFSITKVGKVAGCRVTEGKVERGAGVRLIRDNVVVHEGKLSQLKRFKDDAKEVVVGQECGMAFESYQDMRVGDVIECYRVVEVARTL